MKENYWGAQILNDPALPFETAMKILRRMRKDEGDPEARRLLNSFLRHHERQFVEKIFSLAQTILIEGSMSSSEKEDLSILSDRLHEITTKSSQWFALLKDHFEKVVEVLAHTDLDKRAGLAELAIRYLSESDAGGHGPFNPARFRVLTKLIQERPHLLPALVAVLVMTARQDTMPEFDSLSKDKDSTLRVAAFLSLFEVYDLKVGPIANEVFQRGLDDEDPRVRIIVAMIFWGEHRPIGVTNEMVQTARERTEHLRAHYPAAIEFFRRFYALPCEYIRKYYPEESE